MVSVSRISVTGKFAMDAGGKAARERCRGRNSNRQLPEFGERVMFHRVAPKKIRGKLEPRWENGVYLGTDEISRELAMGTALGAVKANEFK